jgi:hypothetical protein
MKKIRPPFLIALFVVLPLINLVQEFNANETLQYFQKRPARLFLVAGIGIAGGLVVFFVRQLPSRNQRQLKLWLSGLAAGFVTVVGGGFTLWMAGMTVPPETDPGISKGRMVFTLLFCTIATAGVLWFELWRGFKQQGQTAGLTSPSRCGQHGQAKF